MARHLRRAKNREKEVALFLWPNHPRDEYGSVRDHKDLHDVSGPGIDGRTVYVEVKSRKLQNISDVTTILNSALDQLESAAQRSNLPEDSILVAVYAPTHSRTASALCMTTWHGVRVIMPIETFKSLFCASV